jgi:mycothiol synthase
MNDSLRLSVPDLSDAAAAAGFYRVADAALEFDAYDPFNEQARLDVDAGRRTPIVATVWSQDEHSRPIGAAIVGRGELDLVVDPLFRGKGFGEIALRGLLSTARGALTAWSHGDHPAARVLAEHHGFLATRTLLMLRLADLASAVSGLPPAVELMAADDNGISIGSFDPDTDSAEWVALNARTFAHHPEQGGITIEDLHDREREAWFSAQDFLVARDADGHLVGYNWLKVEPGSTEGEIYVIGVGPEQAGHGLGRRLMQIGLAHLAERGCTAATLYVEADNTPAVALYRSLGFVNASIDVQYSRPAPDSSTDLAEGSFTSD